VQREITPSITALVGYAGSRGVHMLYEVDDMNMVIPTLSPDGYLFPSTIGSGSKINPNLGAIKRVAWGGDSFYDSLLVGITKRMSHGLQFQTSYTWEKSIDSSSASTAGDQFTNGISSLDWWDTRLTRGLADFNIGRVLVVSATWQLPIAKSVSGPAAWVVNGWMLGAIFKASDGPPFTATWGTGADPQGISNTDDYAFPDRLSGPGCATLVNPGNPDHYIKTQCFALPAAPNMAFWQANCDTTSGVYGPNLTTEPFPVCFNLRGNAGRNIIPGPGLENLDFSVFKDNSIKRISETFTVQFRAEIFNILNHPNFGVPAISNGAGDIFDGTGTPISTAGKLTTTTTDSREIQLALKFKW